MDERRKKQTSTFRVVQIPGSEMFPLCLNGWIRCWQQVSMHRSNITLFISPKTRAGWSFLYVLIQMWLTRPDQTRAHPTNHIHAGSADYSCRYQDIIGWKEKGIKTFIYYNICAFQFCLSPMSHRTFGYLCRSAGQFIQFVRLTHRLISTPADTWSRLWGRISGACIWTAVEYFAPDVWTVRFLLKHKQIKTLFLLLSVLNESSQEEVSIRDVRILPNLNASYLPMMPDGSVLLVDNVWYVQKRVFVWSWVFTFLCQSVKIIALWSASCPAPQPPVRRGRHGVFLQSGQPGRPPSQHAQRFGGAWLPVPAAPKRHAARRLQRGSDMFVCFTYDLLYCLYKWFHSCGKFSVFCFSCCYQELCQDTFEKETFYSQSDKIL